MADIKRPNRRLLRSAGWTVLALLVAAFTWNALAPKPVVVETATLTRGRLEVTIDQQGEVRVHDRYVVAAPVAGKLVRIELHEGDAIRSGTVVAELEIAPVDPRSRQEAQAKLAAARAFVREADQRIVQAEAELDQATREVRRMDRLVTENFVSKEAAEKTRTAERTAVAAVQAARSRAVASRSEEQAVATALLAPTAGAPVSGQRMKLRAPATGTVLRVLEQSERTVAAGTPLLLIGDPARFEIVADVLSTDAVKIRTGMPATIEQWGGSTSIRARVRTVEPYAFTKVSSLGIEEKRVNIVFDPIDPLGALGDGYRVETRTVIWSSDDVLKIPASALFRTGDSWAAFVVANGRATKRVLEIGARNAREAEVRADATAGDVVVNYPANELTDGAAVRNAAKAVAR